jgi:UDP-GlcNAc:undecaprenyl-phosphate GlcNAc-1-phosphate transferase
VREYLLTLCITAAVTYLLTGPVRKFAIVAGAMPEIRARDVHREPTPRLGGIAMFFGLCAGLLVADHLANLSTVFENSNEPRALLSGAALIWLIGVLDDKFEIDALIKLGGQMIAAGVMVMQGLTILWLPIPGVGSVALTQWQGTLLTVALVVITINAVNFVDGLDGLAAGMVCIASAAFFLYAYRVWVSYGIEAAAPATLFSAILMGMCLGFLPHNMHPARIFMGDSGSMLIGLVLAAGAISITGQVDPDALKLFAGSEKAAVHQTVPVYIPLLLPLTIIAIPAADLVLAIVRRTWRGQSPFAADRGHHVLLVGADRVRRPGLLGELGVHVDRPRHRVPQRHRPRPAPAAALHAAHPEVGPGLRAAALPAPGSRVGTGGGHPAGAGRRGRGGAAHSGGGRGGASQRRDRSRRPFTLPGPAESRIVALTAR